MPIHSDTDCISCALGYETVEQACKSPEHYQRLRDTFFPTLDQTKVPITYQGKQYTITKAAIARREPGLFKVESDNKFICCLGAKMVCCEKVTGDLKLSMKGVVKRQWRENKSTEDVKHSFLQILRAEQQYMTAVNRGIRAMNDKSTLGTYQQLKKFGNYLYDKGQLHEDRITIDFLPL